VGKGYNVIQNTQTTNFVYTTNHNNCGGGGDGDDKKKVHTKNRA